MHPAERKQNLQRLQRELKHLREEPVPGVHAAVSCFLTLPFSLVRSAPCLSHRRGVFDKLDHAAITGQHARVALLHRGTCRVPVSRRLLPRDHPLPTGPVGISYQASCCETFESVSSRAL